MNSPTFFAQAIIQDRKACESREILNSYIYIRGGSKQ
jgi:hypothetical protein